jgi:translation elongation factor EF-Tu-like GTPase
MADKITKKDLLIAREVGMDDVIAFINHEKLDTLTEEQSVKLAEELLEKTEQILGYANRYVKE